jgi:hypothetical protein
MRIIPCDSTMKEGLRPGGPGLGVEREAAVAPASGLCQGPVHLQRWHAHHHHHLQRGYEVRKT